MDEIRMAPIRIKMPDQAPKIIRKEMIPDARALSIVPIRAFKDRRLTAGQFRALGTLCSYTNKAGLLWAGLERMGKDLGISRAAMHIYVQALERMGYVETVYKGFKGERADTRRIIYNPGQSIGETMRKTETAAPYVAEKQAKQARKARAKQAKQGQDQAPSIVNVQDVDQSAMQDVHDVMQLKNKVSAKIWQLAIARAGTDNDYTKLKQAIDRLLR
jgi:DNA-binding MarR family transcriptional regulator